MGFKIRIRQTTGTKQVHFWKQEENKLRCFGQGPSLGGTYKKYLTCEKKS